jgi:deferrochelatase/peroxidase EfeB
MTITAGAGTLAWKTAAGDDLIMLNQLQPNIVKGHVREHMTVMFLRFDTQVAGATFVRNVATTAGLMKSARAHLLEIEAHKQNPLAVGTVYVGLGLTAAGYTRLGVAAAKQPSDPSFRRGMRDATTRATLADPSLANLEAPYRGDIHCVVLVGDATVASVSAAVTTIQGFVGAGVTVVKTERGLAQRNSNGDGIEHFGYVDGRSQPLFFKEDVEDERLHDTGTSDWDPAFSLSRVVVADKAAPPHETFR